MDTRRGLSFVGAALVLALVVSACGGSPPASSAGRASASSFGRQSLAFAACMRSHGQSSYPDPQISSSAGQLHVKISPGTLNPDSPAFKAAETACHSLLPDGGAPRAAGGGSAREQAQGLRFAACMRSHGVPNFPDPDRDGAFTLPPGVDQRAPGFKTAVRACMKDQPSSLLINQPSD